MRTQMQSPPERPRSNMSLLAELRYIGAVGSATKHTRPANMPEFFNAVELDAVAACCAAGVSVADCAAQIIAGRATVNAPLRIVRTDRDGTAVEVSREADSQTAQNLKASLRLFRQGWLACYVHVKREEGPEAANAVQRAMWDDRNRELAEAAYEAVYGRAS